MGSPPSAMGSPPSAMGSPPSAMGSPPSATLLLPSAPSQPYGLPPLRTGRATGLANAAVDKGGRGTISVDTLARLPVLGGTGMAGAMGAKTCAANF
ncbi:hypothetical protein PtA15_8A583 [Puccinia triticina]|uniref:Uncharacterized protein n=1 Tax=Puccinia triticina TaxID=208348 RepID=A0ABY7CUL8_9BASI|nr:uncharacterized protein PtA15_8A583 [Puccinia triticina]WAQ87677.1 hypothetical protein PtA15_8A583 [Puccinia triticina]